MGLVNYGLGNALSSASYYGLFGATYNVTRMDVITTELPKPEKADIPQDQKLEETLL